MSELTIDDSDLLYRRLFHANIYPENHKKTPGEVNSTAYTDHGEPQQSISVELARMTTVDSCLARGRIDQGIGVLRAGDIRALGLSIRHTPENGETEAHCDIEPTEGAIITMYECRALAKATRVIVKPQPPLPLPHR